MRQAVGSDRWDPQLQVAEGHFLPFAEFTNDFVAT